MIFVPITIALGLGLLASRSRTRRRVKRNPEMFKWKISKAILAELYYYEVDNIDSESREGSAKEMALALEAAGRKGPKTLTLSYDASWDLHSALDSMADIKLNGGGDERALGRATAKLRDTIATALNEKSNPNLGNTGLEFKQHAALRILQDKIEQHMGKQITLAQAKELIVAMERDLRMKSFRVIEGTRKRRANPMSLRAVDALVSLCKRKWGGQAAGWAADFANICRRGTPQKKLWAQVAQALKREMYAR